MSVVVSKRRVGAYSYVVEWVTSPTPGAEVRVFVDEVLVVTTEASFWAIDVLPGDSVDVEVLDDPDAEPSPAFPGRGIVQWNADVAAAMFGMDYELEGNRVRLQTLRNEGRAQQQWPTPLLADGVDHRFWVVPIGEDRNEGVGQLVVIPMIRKPDLPDGDGVYDAGTGLLEFA